MKVSDLMRQCRSHSVCSHHGRVKSHLGDDISPGGSSGGSAVAVATDECWA